MSTYCSIRRARVSGRLAAPRRCSTAKRFWLVRFSNIACASGRAASASVRPAGISAVAGPAYATSSLSIYSYKQAFDNGELGFGMASSILTLIALVIIFGPLMRNSARERDPR